MSDPPLRIGLVLTGGGARAAYHVGVLRALSRAPVSCVAIAGVGAGALNGLVVAGSDDLETACAELERLWRQVVLSPQSALQIGSVPVARLGLYLTLLYAGGANPAVQELLKAGGRGIGRARQVRALTSAAGGKLDLLMQVVEVLAGSLNVSTDVGLDATLSGRLLEATDAVNRPFFVSTLRTGDGLVNQLKLVLQGSGMMNPGSPTYLPVHEMAPRDRLAAVLASAAIPFACEPRAVGEVAFVDGSYGGLMSSAGAVPVAPLLGLGNLDAILVVHTDLASAFDASAFKGAPILEIKPAISSGSADVGYFWADGAGLQRWMNQGECDAERTLGTLFDALRLGREVCDAHEKAKRSEDALDQLE